MYVLDVQCSTYIVCLGEHCAPGCMSGFGPGIRHDSQYELSKGQAQVVFWSLNRAVTTWLIRLNGE